LPKSYIVTPKKPVGISSLKAAIEYQSANIQSNPNYKPSGIKQNSMPSSSIDVSGIGIVNKKYDASRVYEISNHHSL
jgi:hypothetical protein